MAAAAMRTAALIGDGADDLREARCHIQSAPPPTIKARAVVGVHRRAPGRPASQQRDIELPAEKDRETEERDQDAGGPAQ